MSTSGPKSDSKWPPNASVGTALRKTYFSTKVLILLTTWLGAAADWEGAKLVPPFLARRARDGGACMGGAAGAKGAGVQVGSE